MEHAYAEALWKMVEGGMDAQKAVSTLRETLARHGREALLPRIGRAFARIALRAERKKGSTLSVAEEKDAAGAKRAAKDVLETMQVDADDVNVQIDDTLIGGWRLEGRERLFDASYKKALLLIYNRATQ